ncbi:hypothetical protein HK096_005245, partial [Nowakowskiella sp. JEL0078]
MGKLAQRIALALRGKYKPTYHPTVDSGDYVVVINARNVDLTGNKKTDKPYRWHSGYIGHVTNTTFDKFKERHPTAPLKKAVYGMLPKNNLRKVQMNRLLLFPDAEHPYEQNIMKNYETVWEAGLVEENQVLGGKENDKEQQKTKKSSE